MSEEGAEERGPVKHYKPEAWRRSRVVQVRLNTGEKEGLQALANKHHTSQSSVIRLLMEAALQTERDHQLRCITCETCRHQIFLEGQEMIDLNAPAQEG